MNITQDVTDLLRSRHTLLWIVTREEARVEGALVNAAALAKMRTLVWDCANGIQSPAGKVVENVQDPIACMRRIVEDNTPTLYIMRDLHKWMDPPTQRTLRNLARSLQASYKSVVVLTPIAEVPPELAGHATVIDWPLPDRAEIGEILDAVLSATKTEQETDRKAAIDAAVGLSAEEVANCYAKSLVTVKYIDARAVAQEKKRVIAREKVLTWIDPDPRGLEAIGGLGAAKRWLLQRKLAFSERAREFGLPSPKGVLVVGPPGTGKSLLAKCVPTAFGMPLLRLDMGALKSKWVGESEANIRKALATAEAISPCVLWVDEIEKALGGSGSQAADGGVSSDALGSLLTWQQEQRGVFLVATANDISSLPPELLRKGRFDELFFVDLPTAKEREEVLRATLADFGSRATNWANSDKSTPIDVEAVAAATADFAGAEIAALVPDALFAAFADGGRQLTTNDLLAAAQSVTPLSSTARDKITKLREWAKGRCRMAGEPDAVTVNAPRALRID